MPAIFEARCESCSYTSEPFAGDVAAVFVDEPNDDGSATVRRDTPSAPGAVIERRHPLLVRLHHPGEAQQLESLGYTWASANEHGRHVKIEAMACQSCGAIYEVSHLAFHGGCCGCSAGILAFIVVGLIAGFWWHMASVGLVAGCVAALALERIVDWSRKRSHLKRFAERRERIDGPRNCPRCGATDPVKPSGSQVVPCPKCKARTLRFHLVGKS